MTWPILALLAALFSGLSSVVEKKALLKEHPAAFSTGIAIINLLIISPLILFISIPNLKTMGFIFAASLFGTVGFLSVMKALKRGEISMVSPVIGLESLPTVILAILILGEKLTAIHISAITLILIGIYILESRYGGDLLSPFKALFREKFFIFVALALAAYPLSSIFAKVALNNTDPLSFLFFAHIFIIINFLTITFLAYDGFEDIKKVFREVNLAILGSSFLVTTSRFFLVFALSIGPVSLVMPLKHTAPLFSALIGGKLFHDHELPKRVFASVFIILGAILLLI